MNSFLGTHLLLSISLNYFTLALAFVNGTQALLVKQGYFKCIQDINLLPDKRNYLKCHSFIINKWDNTPSVSCYLKILDDVTNATFSILSCFITPEVLSFLLFVILFIFYPGNTYRTCFNITRNSIFSKQVILHNLKQLPF